LLLKQFEKLNGLGIAAPSANRFGAVSPTSGSAVEEELGNYLCKKDLILDDGDCEIGVESSIIDCTNIYPVVLRPGAITTGMIEGILNFKMPSGFEKNQFRAPGSFESHYTPTAKIVIGGTAEPGEGFIALAHISTPKGVIRLASPKNIDQYAKVLYKAFRAGDQNRLKKIIVIEPDGDELAIAIRDRTRKAAFGN
jgi:L-threonylcarbamoyladenylate synthase